MGEMMNTNQKNVSVLTVVISLLVSVVSGIGTATIVFKIYQEPQLAMYQKQLNIMNETLSIQHEQIGIMNNSLSVQHEQIGIMKETSEKRVQLVLEVVPRYDWNVSIISNGSVQLTNTTLTVPRNEKTVFHVYVSNVGNSIAHLLYWTVVIFTEPSGLMHSGPMYDIQNIVLGPYGLYNMTYTFDPSTIDTYYNEMVLTFALMSTESIVYETVNATFRQQ